MDKAQDHHYDASIRFIDAKMERYAAKERHETLTRDMIIAVRDGVDGIRYGVSLGSEIQGCVLQILEEALNNQIPTELRPLIAKSRGAPKDSLAIKESKSYAILYRQAARAGDIKNRTYMKYVSNLCGCSKQAICDWEKQYPDVNWVDFKRDKSLEERTSILLRLLKRNARNLREFSRTNSAIRSRVRKGPTK